MKQAKAVIIGGSSTGAYDHNPSEYALLGWIATGFKTNPNLKWVGVCHGHQVLAHALGG